MRSLFVYGTLKEDYGNSRLFPPGTIHRPAITEPGFTIYDDGIPFLVRVGTGRVRGEVVEVDDETLERCDRLEGHPNWYRRTPIGVRFLDSEGVAVGEVFTAEAYLQPRPPYEGEPLWDDGTGASWER